MPSRGTWPGDGILIGQSWTHKLARPLVRPLVGTGITPNHITTARLVTGLMAIAALLPGDATWTWWAGWMWLLSAFLDRADGELARVGNMASLEGQAWDYQVDLIVNPAFFVAIGVGLRHSVLGDYAIPLGIIAGGSVFLGAYWSKALELRQGPSVKAYTGAFGFDLDDLLYLFAPLAWLGWLMPILVGAAIGGSLMALLTAWRLYRLIGRQARENG
jgi:archaetidylinositol phosphate synthase